MWGEKISGLLLVFCPLSCTQNCPKQAALLPLFVCRIPVPVLDLCQMQYYLSLISQVNLIIKKKKKGLFMAQGGDVVIIKMLWNWPHISLGARSLWGFTPYEGCTQGPSLLLQKPKGACPCTAVSTFLCALVFHITHPHRGKLFQKSSPRSSPSFPSTWQCTTAVV